MDAALQISDGAVYSHECNSRQQPTAGTFTCQNLTLSIVAALYILSSLPTLSHTRSMQVSDLYCLHACPHNGMALIAAKPALSHCPIPSCNNCAAQDFRHSFSPLKDSHAFSCHHSGRAKLGLPGWSSIVLSASCCAKLHCLSQEGQVHRCCRRCSLTAGKVCVFQDPARYI